MNTVSILITLIIAGIASIGMAILGKYRPDIVWKNRMNGTIQTPERQKFGFIVLLISGIMILMAAGAISVPQWQSHIDAIVISIVMGMTIVLLFPMWKYVLSRIKGFRTFSLVLCIIASVAMIVFCIYYWHITLA